MNNKENDFIGKIAIDSKNKGIIISTFEEKQIQTQNQNFNLIQNNTDSISLIHVGVDNRNTIIIIIRVF